MHPNTIESPATATEFRVWLSRAAPGEHYDYHRGFLPLDMHPDHSELPQEEREALLLLAHDAYRAAEHDLVHLVQRRLGQSRFAYLAIMRPRGTELPSRCSALADQSRQA